MSTSHISNVAFATAEANEITSILCNTKNTCACPDTDTAASLLCLLMNLGTNSCRHTIYVCVYIYIKNYAPARSLLPIFQFFISHWYFHLIPIYQRVTEQVELLSAS